MRLGVKLFYVAQYLKKIGKSIIIGKQLNTDGKRILKSKNKIYVADSGIRATIVLGADIVSKPEELGYATETSVFKHVKDYYFNFNSLYDVGYIRNAKGAEIDIAVQYAGEPLQYIEAKMRNRATIKDDDGIVLYGIKGTPGYVISKENTDYGLSQKEQTSLYRIPAFAFLYLIGNSELAAR